MKNSVLFLSIMIGLAACNKSTSHGVDKGKTIAKVRESLLFESDLNNHGMSYLSKQDSLSFINQYANNWADNELFYQEALNYLTEEELDIHTELENYKKELLSYKFQTKLINEKLDTNITNSQIEDYYNSNPQLFLLKNNILKVLYIKVPKNIPNIEKFKKLCVSTNPKDSVVLANMCIQYANNYYLNNNTWLMLEDLKNEINPLKEVPEYEIKNGKVFEFTDATSFYFLKIIDIKSKNTLSPLNFEKNKIKNMLINQRKKQLILSIKKVFFDKAKTNKELEIYN